MLTIPSGISKPGGRRNDGCATRDPQPVEIINAKGSSPLVLTVEHAGRAIPQVLGDLGIAREEMDRHIAYDVGAEALGRIVAALLDAPLLLQRYSRLVVDCNRPFDAPDLIPAVSDGTVVPANKDLTLSDRTQRYQEIHQPFHDAVAMVLNGRQSERKPTVLLSLHSFTPVMGGKARPWQLGALFNRDRRLADRFMGSFQALHPEIVSAFNEPYLAEDISDYTVPVHGEARQLPHMLLEIRHNEIDTEEGQQLWAQMLCTHISQVRR